MCIIGINKCELRLRAAPASSLIGETTTVALQYYNGQIEHHPLYYAIFSRQAGTYVISNYTEAFVAQQKAALFSSKYGPSITVHQDFFSNGFPSAGDRYLLGGPGNDTTLIKIDNNITDPGELKEFLTYLEDWGRAFHFDDAWQQQVWESTYEVHVTGVSAMTRDLTDAVWHDMIVIVAVVLPVGFVVLSLGFWISQHRATGMISCLDHPMVSSRSDCNAGKHGHGALLGDLDDDIIIDGNGAVQKQPKLTLLQQYFARKRATVTRLPAMRAAMFCIVCSVCCVPWTFLNIWNLSSFVAVSSFAPMMLFLVGPLTTFACAALVYAQIWFVTSSPIVTKRAHECLGEASHVVSLLCLDADGEGTGVASAGQFGSSPLRQSDAPGGGGGSRSSRYRDIDDAQPQGVNNTVLSLPEGSALILLDTAILPGLRVGISDNDVLPHCNGSLPTPEAQAEVAKAVQHLIAIRCVFDGIRTFHSVAISLLVGGCAIFGSLGFINVQCLGTAGLSAAIGVFFTMSFITKIIMTLAVSCFHFFFTPEWDSHAARPHAAATKSGHSRRSNGSFGSGASFSSTSSSVHNNSIVAPPPSNGSIAISVSSSAGGNGGETSQPKRSASNESPTIFDTVALFWLRAAMHYDRLQHFLLRSYCLGSMCLNIAVISVFALIATGSVYALTIAIGDVAFFHQVPRTSEHVIYGRRLLDAVTAASTGPAYVVFEAPRAGGVLQEEFWGNVTAAVPSIAAFTGVPLANISSVTRVYGSDVAAWEAPIFLLDEDYRYLWNMNVDVTETLLQIAIYPNFDPYTQAAVPFNEKMGPLCRQLSANASGAFKFVGWYGANAATWATMLTAVPEVCRNAGIAIGIFAAVLMPTLYYFTLRRTREAFNFIVAGLSATSALRKLRRWRLKLAVLCVKATVIIVVVSLFSAVASLASAIAVFQLKGASLERSFPVLRNVVGVTWMVFPFCLPIVLFISFVVLVVHLDEIVVHCAIGHILLIAVDVRDVAATQPPPPPVRAVAGSPTAAEALLGASRHQVQGYGGGADGGERPARPRLSSLSSLTSEAPRTDRARRQLLRASSQLLDACDVGNVQHMCRVAAYQPPAGRVAVGGGRGIGRPLPFGVAPNSELNSQNSDPQSSHEVDMVEENAIREAYYAKWMTASVLHHVQRTFMHSAHPTATLLTPWIVYAVLFTFTLGYLSLMFASTTMINEMGVVLTTCGMLHLCFILPLLMPVLRRLLQLV